MHDSIRHRLCDLELRLERSIWMVGILFAVVTPAPTLLAAQAQPTGAAQQASPTAAVQEHAQKAAPAQQAASTQPPAPDWPINSQPKPAAISWNKQELSIDAANSSLQQILTDVASATGASVDGITKDERIFGTFGPAPARDVLVQLLQGTGYNVMMVGDEGQGLPRQIILSTRNTAKTPQGSTRATSEEADDDAVPEVQYDPPPQPQPQQPPQVQQPMRPGFNPAVPGAVGNPQQPGQQPQGQPQPSPPNQ